ncbi:CHK domain-containing protein [Sergentomyia squamirostris]
MANKEEIKILKFINKRYIEIILKKIEKTQNIEIKKYELKPISNKGDYYNSVMVRVIIDYVVDIKDHLNISLILKTGLDHVYDTSQFKDNGNTNLAEMSMYSEVLHKIHDLLRSVNDHTIICPEIYWQDKTTNSMIFEDLQERNYKCVNKRDRFDVEHTKLVLEKLAKYHAASVILKTKESNLYNGLSNGFLTRNNNVAHSFLKEQYDSLIDVVSGWSNYDYYVKKLRGIRDRFIERGTEAFDPDEDFNVLTHGDLWNNNMMFNYDNEGNPVDVIFVDFQRTTWTSPAVDFLNLIHTCIREEFRLKKQDELAQYYHNILWETLTHGFHYNGKVPSLHELQVMILQRSMHVLVSGLLLQPLFLLDEHIQSGMFLAVSTDEAGRKFRKIVYSKPDVIKSIRNLLPYLDTKGLLD